MGKAGFTRKELLEPAGEKAVPADLEKYGFSRWDPPDAGAKTAMPIAPPTCRLVLTSPESFG